MWTTVLDLLGDLLEAVGSVGYCFWSLLRSIIVVPCRFCLKLVRGGGELAWNIFWISMVARMVFRLILALGAAIALFKAYQTFKPDLQGVIGGGQQPPRVIRER